MLAIMDRLTDCSTFARSCLCLDLVLLTAWTGPSSLLLYLSLKWFLTSMWTFTLMMQMAMKQPIPFRAIIDMLKTLMCGVWKQNVNAMLIPINKHAIDIRITCLLLVYSLYLNPLATCSHRSLDIIHSRSTLVLQLVPLKKQWFYRKYMKCHTWIPLELRM